MKKIVLFALAVTVAHAGFSQIVDSTIAVTTATPLPKQKKVYDLSNRANDHFMVQFGITRWMDKPDSIQTSGFSRSINAYFMYDVPFKSSPKLSAAIGIGIGSDHIVFKDKPFMRIAANTSTLGFNQNAGADSVYFKKTKLATSYLEAPVELRFVARPDNSDRSFKAAIGVKVGTMLRANTRSRDLMSKSGNTIESKLMKEASKAFFNTTRIVGTARVGYGHFSLFANYQFTTVLKSGVGAEVKPFTVGLTLSGL